MIEAIKNEEFGRKLNEIENDWIDEVRILNFTITSVKTA